MKTCNRCGATGLVWAKSKKGNWYLSAPESVGAKRGVDATVYFAHRCETAQDVDWDSINDAKNSAMFDAGYAGII